MVWLQLLACVVIIFFLGRRVAQYGDIIAVKTKLGGLWIGLVLISITTSLPELFTGVSAIFIVNAPDITVGNLLGANTFNLLNLAFLAIHLISLNPSPWSAPYRLVQSYLVSWSPPAFLQLMECYSDGSAGLSHHHHPLPRLRQADFPL